MVDSLSLQLFIDNNGRTQLPTYAIAEALSCKLDWKVESNGIKTVVFTSPSGDVVKIVIGENTMLLNDIEIEMDTQAIVKDEIPFVPLRFVAEAMGLSVEWDNN